MSAATSSSWSSFSGQPDRFLVCGLGSLGQHCVAHLKTFGVLVSAVDINPPQQWEVSHLPELLEQLLIGDCCHSEILEKAGVSHCRAVLLVTENERVNLEAALTARVLNPTIRLVVRSDKANLNELLGLQLPNFVAFEPTQLAAPAFALSAYSDELIGFFQVGQVHFRVRKQIVHRHHPWRNRRCLYELESRQRQVLRHIPANRPMPEISHFHSPSEQFYTWLPNTTLREGDEVVTVEATLDASTTSFQRRRRYRWSWRELGQALRQFRGWPDIKRALVQFWQVSYREQIRRVALLCGITVAGLCILSTILMLATGVSPTLMDAFYATAGLLLGGYTELFSQFALEQPLPWWLPGFSLIMTLAGTALIGVLYALLTEKLLTLQFEFLTRRPPVPKENHVVVIALGRVGRRVVSLLQELNQVVVGITRQAANGESLPQLPLIVGELNQLLDKANIETAKSVVAVSEDEMLNLEMGLMAYRANPRCRLIIRTYDQLFSDKVARLFPYAQVLCSSALSAEAFAGAAFGENVVGLFRLYHQTVLVTQYEITPEDTLQGLLLSEVAYGYGVVPLWYQRAGQTSPTIMPMEDLRLQVGDRLVVLSTIRGLRRIEQGQMAVKWWRVRIDGVQTVDARFQGANELALISGCDLALAREFMHHLPGVFPMPLYRHQALRLVRLLLRSQVKAQVIAPVDLPLSPHSSR